MKKRVKLDSSAIAFATYDFEGRTLDLEFREGHNYRYFNVPQFAFESLLKAESAGAFWNSVKDSYRYQRGAGLRKEKARHLVSKMPGISSGNVLLSHNL